MSDRDLKRQLQRVSRANFDRFDDGEVADSYLQESHHRRRLEIAFKLLAAGIRGPHESARVLDVGGVAQTALTLTSMKFRTYTAGFGLTGRWPPESSRVVMDASEGLPFRDGVFDAVFAGELIEHLFDPLSFLKDVRRVLRVGGIVVLTTPNLATLQDRILFLFGRSPRNVDPLHPYLWLHIRPCTNRKLQEMLTASAFGPMTLRTNEISVLLRSCKIAIPGLDKLIPSLGRSLIVSAQAVPFSVGET